MLTILLGLATGSATYTLCRSKVTEPLRRLLSRSKFVAKMLACLYCTSHWIALGLVLLAQPEPAGYLAADLIVGWLAAVAIAAPTMWAVTFAHTAWAPKASAFTSRD